MQRTIPINLERLKLSLKNNNPIGIKTKVTAIVDINEAVPMFHPTRYANKKPSSSSKMEHPNKTLDQFSSLIFLFNDFSPFIKKNKIQLKTKAIAYVIIRENIGFIFSEVDF